MIRWMLLGCLLLATTAAGQNRAFTVETVAATLDGEAVKIDVYRPYDTSPEGVAIVAHGFTRGRERQREFGKALAAAGIVAVVPDLPHVVDHWRNGDAIAELARMLEGGALGLDPVERSRIVLIGTSAGGLSTVLAAAKLPGIGGWIGLDPVDRTGSGVRAAEKIAAPAVVLLAEPSGCNLFGSGKAIARAAPGLLRSTVLHGASHCDFEGPTTKFCRAICGASDASMALRAREETVAAAAELLHRAAIGPGEPAH